MKGQGQAKKTPQGHPEKKGQDPRGMKEIESGTESETERGIEEDLQGQTEIEAGRSSNMERS